MDNMSSDRRGHVREATPKAEAKFGLNLTILASKGCGIPCIRRSYCNSRRRSGKPSKNSTNYLYYNSRAHVWFSGGSPLSPQSSTPSRGYDTVDADSCNPKRPGPGTNGRLHDATGDPPRGADEQSDLGTMDAIPYSPTAGVAVAPGISPRLARARIKAGCVWDKDNWSCAYDTVFVSFLFTYESTSQVWREKWRRQGSDWNLFLGVAFDALLEMVQASGSHRQDFLRTLLPSAWGVFHDKLSSVNPTYFKHHGQVPASVCNLLGDTNACEPHLDQVLVYNRCDHSTHARSRCKSLLPALSSTPPTSPTRLVIIVGSRAVLLPLRICHGCGLNKLNDDTSQCHPHFIWPLTTRTNARCTLYRRSHALAKTALPQGSLTGQIRGGTIKVCGGLEPHVPKTSEPTWTF